MGIFAKSDPDAKLQRELHAKRDLLADNGMRQGAAGIKLADSKAAVELAARESDEAALDRALQARRAAEDKLAALQFASTKIGEEIADIEGQLAQLADQRERIATAAAVAVMVERWETAQAGFIAATQALESVSTEAGLIVPEAQGTTAFLQAAREQIPPAGSLITSVLGNYAKGVLAGSGRPSLPKPAPAPPQLAIVPSEPTVTIFAMTNLKFTNAEGAVVCCGRYRRHNVPQRLAEIGIRSGMAIPLTDKRVKSLEGQTNSYGFVPEPGSCSWLGPAGEETPAPLMRMSPPVVHSSLTKFENADRGPAITGTMPTPPFEAMPKAAMRSEGDNET